MPDIYFLTLIGHVSPQGICKISTKGLLAGECHDQRRPHPQRPLPGLVIGKPQKILGGVGFSSGLPGETAMLIFIRGLDILSMARFLSSTRQITVVSFLGSLEMKEWG